MTYELRDIAGIRRLVEQAEERKKKNWNTNQPTEGGQFLTLHVEEVRAMLDEIDRLREKKEARP